MRNVPAATARLVHQRANGRCEYCLYAERYSIKRHEMDHILARKHDGGSTEENLCLSCADCNRHKGTDLASVDPQTGAPTLLFHPRQDRWSDHFYLTEDGLIDGITIKGRATAKLLKFNETQRVAERKMLMDVGLFP